MKMECVNSIFMLFIILRISRLNPLKKRKINVTFHRVYCHYIRRAMTGSSLTYISCVQKRHICPSMPGEKEKYLTDERDPVQKLRDAAP